MDLDSSRAVVVLDTSAVLELFIFLGRGGSSWPHRFEEAVTRRWGSTPQLVFHPITLAELATLSHEEVHQSRISWAGPRPAAELAFRANANRNALIALRACVEGRTLAPDFDMQAFPILPTWSDYGAVAQQREDYRMLRCTTKSGVVPVSALADHMILATAVILKSEGFNSGLVSGDREQLGAGQRLGVEVLYIKDLAASTSFPWKDCARDGNCVAGCVSGVADCERMFS